MTASSSSSSYIITHHVVLQTSLGTLVVGLYGADFPATTAHFINLARAQLFQGAAMTAIVPEHAAIFSQTLSGRITECSCSGNAAQGQQQVSPPTVTGSFSLCNNLPMCSYCAHLHREGQAGKDVHQSSPFNFYTIAAAVESNGSDESKKSWGKEDGKRFHDQEMQLNTALQAEFNSGKQKKRCIPPGASKSSIEHYHKPAPCSTSTAEWEWVSGTTGNPALSAKASGSLHRKGLLFVPSPCSVAQASTGLNGLDYFGFTLVERLGGSGNVLDRGHIAIGEITDGWEVLEQLRRQPHGPLVSFSSSPPLRGSRQETARYTQWPCPLKMTRVYDLQCVPLGGRVPIWKLQEAVHNPSLFIQNMPSAGNAASFGESCIQKRAAGVLNLLGSGVAYIAPTETVVLVNRAVVQLLRADESEDCFTQPRTTGPLLGHKGISLVLWRPVELDAKLACLPHARDDRQKKGKVPREELQEDPFEIRRRERYWRHVWIEDGVQRLIANPRAYGPLLPSDSDSDELDARDGIPLVQGSPDNASHLLKQKQVVESLSLAMHILDDIPVGSSSLNAQGDVQLVEPCERTLFVCRLNAVTTSEGLAECFSAFGPVLSCNVIRDAKTGSSLRYAFIEFSTKEACYAAYQKMNHVLIDDSRIVTEFSESIRKSVQQYQSNSAASHSVSSHTTIGKKRQRE